MIAEDWEVAYDQFVLAGNKNSTAHRPQKAGETTFTVDKETGALTSLNLNGKELLSTPVTLSFSVRLRIMIIVIRTVHACGVEQDWTI